MRDRGYAVNFFQFILAALLFAGIGYYVGLHRGVDAAADLAEKCYASDIAAAIREITR